MRGSLRIVAWYMALLGGASVSFAGPAYNASGTQDFSAFALGSHRLNVVFVESDGTIDPDTESWTGVLTDQVKDQVDLAVDYWEGQTSGYHPNTQLDLQVSYSVGYTGYEPISNWGVYAEFWIEEIMGSFGHNDGDSDDRVRSYNQAERVSADTNWSTTVFVVNSYNDLDGAFLGGEIAWTWMQDTALYTVLSYDNAFYGIENFHAVLSHELAHHYGALDEYYASGHRNNERSGYLNWLNGNAERDANGAYVVPPEGSNRLMNDTTLLPSSFTMGQVGHVDSDGDSIPDVLDTVPLLSGQKQGEDASRGTVTLVADGVVNPLDNLGPLGSGRSMTVNWISGAAYRIDGGEWVHFTPDDGLGDEYSESFAVTIDKLPPATYLIDLAVINSVGNWSAIESYSFVSEVKVGDADCDADVDFADFNALAGAYNFGTTWAEGDFDFDGDVDFTDFNKLANNYGYECAPGVPGDLDVDEVELVVDIETGEMKLVSGGAVELNGYSIKSESGVLIADADGAASPFMFYLANTASEVAAGNVGSTYTLDGELILDAGFAGDQNLTFEYGTAAGTIAGDIQYVPEPATLSLLAIGGSCGLLKRRRRA